MWILFLSIPQIYFLFIGFRSVLRQKRIISDGHNLSHAPSLNQSLDHRDVVLWSDSSYLLIQGVRGSSYFIHTTSTKAGDYAKGMWHQQEEKKRSSCSLSILFTFYEQTWCSILKMTGEVRSRVEIERLCRT